MAETRFDFMGLPAELREAIYSYTFSLCLDSSFEVLAHAQGPDAGLLATSSFIRKEGEPTYLKAAIEHEARRRALLERFTVEPPIPQHPDDKAVAHAIGLGGTEYLALAISYASQRFGPQAPHSSETPQFFEIDGSGSLTDFGLEVQAYCEAWDALDEKDSFSRQATYALDWWRLEFNKQGMIDIRCRVRKAAVEQALGMRAETVHTAFTVAEHHEEYVTSIEKTTCDGMEAFEVFNQEWYGGCLDWRKEYDRRTSRLLARGSSDQDRAVIP
ncbi:hypothetical protein LTR85_002666 [Meristemomyces frigidus]|nr:hypothetical protein LTR85_002666 [Meristemomyces frigidus]